MKNLTGILKIIILLVFTSISLSAFADWPWLYCVVSTTYNNGYYQENNFGYLYQNGNNMFDNVLAAYGSDDKDKKNSIKITWWGGPNGANYLQIFVDNGHEVILPNTNKPPYHKGRFVYNYQKNRLPSVLTFENSDKAKTFCSDLRSLCKQSWRNAWRTSVGGDDQNIRAGYYGHNDTAFNLIVLYQETNKTTGEITEKPMACFPPSEFTK